MSEKLSQAQTSHRELFKCTMERLEQVIACMLSPTTDPLGDSGSESDSDASDQPSFSKSEGRDRSPQAFPAFGCLPSISGLGLPFSLQENLSADGISDDSCFSRLRDGLLQRLQPPALGGHPTLPRALAVPSLSMTGPNSQAETFMSAALSAQAAAARERTVFSILPGLIAERSSLAAQNAALVRLSPVAQLTIEST
jgi:hypothetical protein